MIAFLRGKLKDIHAGAIILDVCGVGYKVQVPLSLLHKLPGIDNEVSLHTHLVVRENCFDLYGFQDRGELEYFLKLLNVSGVGPKGALAILTIFSPGELGRAILDEDTTSLIKAPGVGKKTAGRIILELKDKIQDIPLEQEVTKAGGGQDIDAVEALEALGYSPAEARRAVRGALEKAGGKPPVAEIVRNALRLLVKK